MPANDRQHIEPTTLVEYSPSSRQLAPQDQPGRVVIGVGSPETVGKIIVAVELCCKVRPSKRIAVNERAIIGRVDEQNAIPFDPLMSRQHFLVELTELGAFVEDQRSTNGTWLNGRRISKARLSHRDQIRAGMTIFEIKLIEVTEQLS